MRNTMQGRFMFTAVTVGLLALTSSSGIRGAGTNATEGAAIRKLVAAIDNRGRTPQSPRVSVMPDQIFWSGAYKRPIVSPEKGEPRTGSPGAIENRVPGSQRSKTEVLRIVVADSRDLAYEYSKARLAFDLKSGDHVSFDSGVLRVWQKQDGEWRIAASFSFPYERPQP